MAYCTQCGNENQKDTKFCSNCGSKVQHTPLKITSAEIADNQPSKSSAGQHKHIISPLKFFILSVVTLGIYPQYYAWRCWEIVKTATGEKLSPTWRGLWLVFSCFYLFPRLFKVAEDAGDRKRSYAPLLATALMLILVILRAIDRHSTTNEYEFGSYLLIVLALMAVITLIMLPAINATNYILINTDTEGEKFSYPPNAFIIFITVVVLLVSMFQGLLEGSIINPSDAANQMVKELKSDGSLPMKVDEVTTLYDASSAGSTLRYHYQITGSSHLSNADLDRHVTGESCKSSDIQSILKKGIDIEHSYLFLETGESHSVKVNQESCQ